MDGNIAEIRLFAGTFAPRNWAFCAGQIMSIAQNNALFSLIGTYYGGDGRTSFGIPDLRGRVAVGAGTGPGLTPRVLGAQFGLEHTQLTLNNLPSHSHGAVFTGTGGTGSGVASGTSTVSVTPIALNDEGDQNSPTGNVPAKFTPAGGSAYGEFDAGSPSDYTDMHPLTGTVTSNLPVTLTNISVTGSVSVNNTGANAPFYITQPSTTLNYIICLT